LQKVRKTITQWILGISIIILPIGGCVFTDTVLAKNAKPPKMGMSEIELLEWLGNRKNGKGKYEYDGEIYNVILGGYGRILPSGRTGYVFKDDSLVDYSLDIGDYRTTNFRWDLTSGSVKDIVPYE
jgi:hypothetical protein